MQGWELFCLKKFFVASKLAPANNQVPYSTGLLQGSGALARANIPTVFTYGSLSRSDDGHYALHQRVALRVQSSGPLERCLSPLSLISWEPPAALSSPAVVAVEDQFRSR